MNNQLTSKTVSEWDKLVKSGKRVQAVTDAVWENQKRINQWSEESWARLQPPRERAADMRL